MTLCIKLDEDIVAALTLKHSCEQKTLAGFGSLRSKHLGHCSLPGLPQLQVQATLHERHGLTAALAKQLSNDILFEKGRLYSTCKEYSPRTWNRARFLLSSLDDAGLLFCFNCLIHFGVCLCAHLRQCLLLKAESSAQSIDQKQPLGHCPHRP